MSDDLRLTDTWGEPERICIRKRRTYKYGDDDLHAVMAWLAAYEAGISPYRHGWTIDGAEPTIGDDDAHR